MVEEHVYDGVVQEDVLLYLPTRWRVRLDASCMDKLVDKMGRSGPYRGVIR